MIGPRHALLHHIRVWHSDHSVEALVKLLEPAKLEREAPGVGRKLAVELGPGRRRGMRELSGAALQLRHELCL